MTEPGIDIEKKAFEVMKDSVNFDGFTPEEIKQEVRRVVDLCLRVQKAERDRCANLTLGKICYSAETTNMLTRIHNEILAPKGEPK